MLLYAVATFEWDALSASLAAVYVLVAAANAACGLGLWRLRPYGRVLQIVFAVLGLGFALQVPLSAIIPILIVIYLTRPGVKALFSKRATAGLSADERTAMEAASRSWIGAAAVILYVGAAIPVGFDVAWSSWKATHPSRAARYQEDAIDTLVSINRAQNDFAIACGGYSATLEALNLPAEKPGYRFRVGISAPVPGSKSCKGAALVSNYLILAEPITKGDGIRFFATNAIGTIYASAGPITPSLESDLGPGVTAIR